MATNEYVNGPIHLYRDSFQNYKVYQIPKAQLIIADVPYNLGTNAYGSNPAWYINGDNSNGESELAGKKFFNSENEFRPAEFMHFCSKMLVNEPKESGKAPCMILFCSFEQQFQFIELAKKIRFAELHQSGFQKEFFRPGPEGQHEDCWKLRIWPFVLQKQIAEVQQSRKYGDELH